MRVTSASESAQGPAGGTPISADDVAVALRDHRRRRGLTLTRLAELSGISAAHLSRIEKRDRTPSIEMLLVLARCYGMTIGELVGEGAEAAEVTVRRREHLVTHQSAHGDYQSLSSSTPGRELQAIRYHMQTHTSSKTSRHEGEEWIHLDSGRVIVTIQGNAYALAEGDSLHFSAHLPHRIDNPHDEAASLLIVSSLSRQTHHSTS